MSGADRTPPLIVVTGASSGIGAALAIRVAAPGVSVGLVGRSADGLEATAAAVEVAGGTALIGQFDITTGAFAGWLEEVSSSRRLHALYANAGLSAGPPTPGELESPEDTERLIATNLSGTIACVRAAVGLMRLRPSRPMRRIGLVSSVAGVLPLADLAVYGATKAGLKQYAHALRPRLRRDGISVSVLCPGFVTSPMSARHEGAKPFEVSAERAANIMVRAVERGQRTCVFPWPFAIMAALEPLGPGWLTDAISPLFNARVAPDPREKAPPNG